MQKKTATILGATGLIGSELLRLLINDNEYGSIRVISRRSLPVTASNVHVIVIDFTDENSFRTALAGSDAVFCAVGTTQRKVKGDKSAYRKVDFDIPATAAKICAETGIPQLIVVSSVGADSDSRSFYLALKGDMENAVKGAGVPSVSIFRPSMLLGNRAEFRLAERLGQAVMSVFSFVIPPKYKPIHGETVARCMVAVAKQQLPGFRVYYYNDMIGLLK